MLNAGKAWKADTVKKYHGVGVRLASMPCTLRELDRLEAQQGRSSIMDGIATLRALTGPLTGTSFCESICSGTVGPHEA